MNIPQSEFDEFSQSVRSHPEYLDTEYVFDKYRQYGLDIIPDPFGAEIMSPIKQALSTGKPLSVIRIGDGETNLLSYGAYPKTPLLNHAVVKKIIAMQKDCFKVDPFWMIMLQDLMMGAPAEVGPRQLRELHLKLDVPKPKADQATAEDSALPI